MDDNFNNNQDDQDDQENQEQGKNDADRAHNAVNKVRSTYKNAKRLKQASDAFKAGRTIAAGAEAAEAVVAAAGSSPVWIPLLIIIIFILCFIMLFAIVFGGKLDKTPSCSSITAESQTTNSANPILITLNNCSPNATYTWSSDIAGGTFTPANQQSTSFTPPTVSATTPVTIVATICDSQITTFCSKNTITLSIEVARCEEDLGGTCTTALLCSTDKQPTIPGASGCSATTGQVCCNYNNPTTIVTPMPIDQISKYFVFNTTVSTANKNALFNMIDTAFGDSTFVNLLQVDKYGKVHLYFDIDTQDNYMHGGANYDQNTMKFWNFFTSPYSSSMKGHIFIHELGHILDRRNNRISDHAYNRTSLIASDPTCYNGRYSNDHNPGNGGSGDKYIKTYPYRDGDLDKKGKQIGGGATHESFADSLSDYVYCRPGVACDYNDIYHSSAIVFNKKCDATYNWFKQHIFGGQEFFQ